ncbi:MAG: hypothetical protein K0Q79_2497 [Flavipsychrobacter sp.]|nr:hypothetical protein [Flavipsychrobacter sp.]
MMMLPIASIGQNIYTIAGTGSGISSGDGGLATAAGINGPGGLAFDNSGNMYVAGYYENKIRKVSPSGVITTIGGTGTAGYSGDGGAATSAQLNKPTKITLDGAGNLYIADQYNNRVRKISTAGIITTIAGNGTGTYGGDGGPATAASLFHPTGLDIDAAGNIYIADNANNRIRKISTAGIITTVAGNGIGGPGGDGGPATAASMFQPFGVVIDGAGNIYIAVSPQNNIRKVNPAGIISTFAGTGIAGFSGDGGSATAAQLSNPCDIAIDGSGNIYIADQLNYKVRKVSASNIISTVVGTGYAGYSGDGGPATAAMIDQTNEIEFDTSGRLVLTDNNNNRVRRLQNCTGSVTTHPMHDTVNEGTDAKYFVVTSMPTPTYQWQEDPGTGFVNLANVWPYSGVFTDTLTIDHTSIFLHTTHYRCIVASGVFCADTSNSAILIVRTTTGMQNTTLSSVNIYPNPVSDEFTVVLPQDAANANIELMDGLGQIVAKQTGVNSKTEFNVGGLPQGMYILRLQYDGEVVYKKILKRD